MQISRINEQFLAHLQIERSLSVNTLSAYRRDLNHYENYLTTCGITDFAQIQRETVSAFLDYLHQQKNGGLQNSSVARILAAVRGMHKFAVTEGLATSDPAHDVKPPKQIKRLPKAITITQMQQLIEAAGTAQTPIQIRDRALFELLYGTGARISEAVNLSSDDLDLENRLILLRGKGEKERLVPLGKYAVTALEDYLVCARPILAAKGRGNTALFLNKRGNPLSRQSAWEAIQEAAKRANLSQISPHTFRHSFATHLLQGGADIRTVQELLGHASVTTTQIYTKVTPETLREIYLTAHPRAHRN